MKIKKLTIHGFKSFVDKVTLHFPSGTSGIIGPNGCGKSNIVDAIRWVLGEQNARHLRGKHMEDIIFNGSELRKPLGMAEVVLTFANDEGTAPSKFANFTEIEIARRLYRSGESEYYINKVQSRLRDIVDLFTDTGIGTRAYSIIEQGQVAWLINAKPEDRRAIFEEAAGINKFKHKKDAALRRLESTKENLTRVNDIISEVKRQLNSLNRQAKKAERYKALKEELQSIDLLLSSLEFHRMKSALEDLGKKIEGIKDEELALTTAVNEKEILAEDIKLEHLNIENEYRAVKEQVFELERLIQNEERSSELARVRIDELNRGEERLTNEIAELKRNKSGAAEQIESLRFTLNELSKLISAESEKLSGNSAQLEALISELRKNEDIQRADKAESLKTSTRLSDIRHAIQTLIRDEENLRFRESKSNTEKENIINALASKEEPLKALKEKLENSASKREAIEDEQREIRARQDSLERDRVSKGEELKKIKDEYSRTAARLSTLEDMEKNFENVKGGAKAILQKGEKGGIYGLIADVIETNSGYEKAVEAVMGDRLQYVLVESHKEGVEAIEYLKTNSAGKGSFIPVKDARPSVSPVTVASVNAAGAKELLTELKIKDGYREIVNFLLGDVLIVENLAFAVEAWKQNSFKTIVTLDGEVIDAQGIITGGTVKGSDAGILQKRGEIKQLKAKAAELGGRITTLEAELKSAEEGIRSTKAFFDECREKLHSVDIEKVNTGNELKRLEDEIFRLTKTRDNLINDIADALRRLTGISEKKNSLSAERDGLEKSLAEREDKIALLATEISALAEKKEKLSQVVTEIRVTLAQAKERFEAMNKQITERERSIADTDRRLETKAQEIEHGRAEVAEKSKQVDALKAKLEGLLSRIDIIKEEEIAKTEALNTLTERIKTIENNLKEFKSRYSELQELKGELTIEHKEMEMSINHLKEKMNERYSTNIEGFRPDEGEENLDIDSLEAKKAELREKITSLGEVSLSALEEYAQLENRHQFLVDQQADLTRSVESLHTAINRINRTTREKFRHTFDEVNKKFQETFPRFFNGGRAELRLSDDGDILETGVEIAAQPPGKRLQNITLLSGGEKALTATALIFAIFLIKPSPFCLLDEVDAPLDEANIDRFNLFVRDMSKISQFLLITHNKKSMEMADSLYGITMQEPGVSKVISVNLASLQ
ncbi:MAG: chromosome segregation protein SMC [Deltaproteobacteria bacterium]|nr:chromosome segregation protein SMC [Deltaproteobacteria bacterium]